MGRVAAAKATFQTGVLQMWLDDAAGHPLTLTGFEVMRNDDPRPTCG